MTIVEAFSVGTPVICSDIGNAGSVVDEGVNGYKFDSVDGIAKVVKKTIEKPLNNYKIHELYQKKYNGEINYKILKEIYDTQKNDFEG